MFEGAYKTLLKNAKKSVINIWYAMSKSVMSKKQLLYTHEGLIKPNGEWAISAAFSATTVCCPV